MRYKIEVHENHYGWDWHVIGLFGAHGANGHAPDEPTARKCAQAVIGALSPQPTTPTDAPHVARLRAWANEHWHGDCACLEQPCEFVAVAEDIAQAIADGGT